MRVRVGIVPNDKHPDLIHLRKSSIILSAVKTKGSKYARAVLSSPEVDCGFMRFPMIGACVIWGSDEGKIIETINDVKYGWYVVVLKEKAAPKLKSTASKLKGKSEVDFFVIEEGCKVSALDLEPGRKITEVSDVISPVGGPALPAPPKAAKVVASSKPAPKAVEQPKPEAKEAPKAESKPEPKKEKKEEPKKG